MLIDYLFLLLKNLNFERKNKTIEIGAIQTKKIEINIEKIFNIYKNMNL